MWLSWFHFYAPCMRSTTEWYLQQRKRNFTPSRLMQTDISYDTLVPSPTGGSCIPWRWRRHGGGAACEMSHLLHLWWPRFRRPLHYHTRPWRRRTLFSADAKGYLRPSRASIPQPAYGGYLAHCILPKWQKYTCHCLLIIHKREREWEREREQRCSW